MHSHQAEDSSGYCIPTESQITATNPKKGRKMGMPKEHHYSISPVSLTKKTEMQGRKKR